MRLQIRWRKDWAYAHGTGPDGARIRCALGTQDARSAEEARAALETRLWKTGLYGAGQVMTFEEAALAYAEDGGESRFLIAMAEQLQGRKIASITPHEIRAAARAAYPGASAATLNRQGITPARAVINYSHAQGWCPMIRVKSFPVAKPQRQAVDRSYLDRLQPHLPERLFVLMLFLFTTGRRVGDAIALEVRDVDLRERRVLIRDPKNGEPAIAVLTAELAGLFAEIMPEAGPVFGYVHRSSIYSTLRRASKKAGVAYLGTHQPGRHSYATILDQEGFSATQIARAGGWKSPRLVAERYIHAESAAEKAARVFGKKPRRRSIK